MEPQDHLPPGCGVTVICPPGEALEPTLANLASLRKRYPVIIRFNGSGFVGGGFLDKLVQSLNNWHAQRLGLLGPACVVNIHPRTWPAVDLCDWVIVLLASACRRLEHSRGLSGKGSTAFWAAFATIMFPMRFREVPAVLAAGLLIRFQKLAPFATALQFLVGRLMRESWTMWTPKESPRALNYVARHVGGSFYLAGYSSGGSAALDALSLGPELRDRIDGVLLQFACLRAVPQGWMPGAFIFRSWTKRMFPLGVAAGGRAIVQKAPFQSLKGLKVAVLRNVREMPFLAGVEDLFHSDEVLAAFTNAGAEVREFVAPDGIVARAIGAHYHADLKVAAAEAWPWLRSTV